MARVTLRAAAVTADSDLPPPPVARRLVLAGRSVVGGLRRAAADGAGQLVAWELKLPEGASRVRQFVHGLWLPVVVARVVLADARVRGRWLRFSLAQVAATLLVAVLALLAGGSGEVSGGRNVLGPAAKEAVAELHHRVDDRAAELEGRAAPVDRALVRAQRDVVHERLLRVEGDLEGRHARGVPAPDELPIFVNRALDDAAMERAARRLSGIAQSVEEIDGDKLKDALKQQVSAVLGGGQQAPEVKPSFDLGEARAIDPRKLEQEIRRKAKAGIPQEEKGEESLAKLLAAVRRGGAVAPAPEQAAKARRIRTDLKAAALSAVPAAVAKLEASRPWSSRLAALGVSWRILGWLLALWGALYGAQFVVIALCRDYHAELSREACLLAGIAPEDPPRAPRPRFDLRWAVMRAWRQFRGWFVISLGIPVCSLAGLAFPTDAVRNTLIAGWIFYWQAVFAASKSQRAWVDEFAAPPPWFIRGWRWLCDKLPLSGLVAGGLYLWIWERFSRSLYAPAECVEQQPAPFVGLMIFRLLGSTPLLKVFTRPLIPVASALLLEAYRVKHPARTVPQVLLAEPVLAPARAS